MKRASNLFPHYWIFQFNPNIYDWFGWIKENERNTEQWLVSRYTDRVSVGDKIVIWCSGEDSGVYGLAEAMTYPLKKPLNSEQAKYYKAVDDVDKFSVKPSVYIKYFKTFVGSPISKDKCKEDSILCRMEILNDFTNATNFKLNKQQWDRIKTLR